MSATAEEIYSVVFSHDLAVTLLTMTRRDRRLIGHRWTQRELIQIRDNERLRLEDNGVCIHPLSKRGTVGTLAWIAMRRRWNEANR